MWSLSVTQVRIAQGGPILYVSFWPHTLADRLCFINYDLCLGASNFTPFAKAVQVLKRTDLILSCRYVKCFMDFKIQQTRLGLP